MEHLFKLKKDGTITGYKKTVNGLIFIKSVTTNTWGCLTKQANFGDFVEYRFAIDEDVNDELSVDSEYSFVTKDKNGKEVFAGDKLLSKDGLRKYKVIWDERRCRWWLCGIEKPWAVNVPIWENYEIIKEKEDA